ncbi:MAG: transcription termination factor NusA [Candidatus Omnitrophica bacterium]|nr:transcription termination factor NusA [Candidatus Omnitrophota bacterium]
MKKEFLSVLAQLEREKGLDRSVLIDAVQCALALAAKKIAKMASPDSEEEVRVEIDSNKGDIHVYIGDKEVVSEDFGRIAAQTARQVIIQKIREAEKDNIYNDYHSRVGDIVGGVVYRFEKKAVIIDLMGKAEGIIPNSFLSPLDRFRIGERAKAYVYEVKKEKGVQIILSRKHEGLVKKMFNLEVPEIGQGVVEIKCIARSAGERTKIAVFSKDEKVDCVGACVGIRGSRVKNIIEELRGEKIDIVRWSDDIKEFIKAALSPAIISMIDLDRENKKAKVLVAADQLSLSIGKKGQNVRLASKLVGWDIDVRSKESMEDSMKVILKLKSVGKKASEILVESGYTNLNSLRDANENNLSKLKGIGKKKAVNIIQEAKDELAKNALKMFKSDKDSNQEKETEKGGTETGGMETGGTETGGMEKGETEKETNLEKNIDKKSIKEDNTESTEK